MSNQVIAASKAAKRLEAQAAHQSSVDADTTMAMIAEPTTVHLSHIGRSIVFGGDAIACLCWLMPTMLATRDTRAFAWKAVAMNTGLTRRRRPISGGEAGFSLIEVLIVLAILSLLFSIVGPQVVGYLGSSRTQVAKVQIQNLAAALELFRLDTGRLPTTDEGLVALVTRPKSLEIWNGPYVRGSKLPVDPWGRMFVYRTPGQSSEFDLLTMGADNQPGGTGENSDVSFGQ